jgi:hypothetical protein
MTLRKSLGAMILAMVFFIAAGAAAKTNGSRSIVLYYDASIAGSHLVSGAYNVEWQTHTPGATVSFVFKGRVVATTGGTVVVRGKKYLTNEVVFNTGPDGTRTVREIRFRGSSEVIVFND